MRILTPIILLWVNTLLFGQVAESEKITIAGTADYYPAIVDVIRNGNKLYSFNTLGGKVTLTRAKTGYYKIIINGLGQRPIEIKDVLVTEGQDIELVLTLGDKCLYDHPNDWIPVCPKKHTNKIIPIVYGFIGRTNASKPNDFYTGGCVVTECDPNFYCKKHKLKF